MKTKTVEVRKVDIMAIEIPWRINMLLDVSTSMDQNNRIKKAKRGIETFLWNVSKQRRNLNDWVTASCFSGYVNNGGNLYYKNTEYYRIAHHQGLSALTGFVQGWDTVSKGTALYNAVHVAGRDLATFIRKCRLPGVNVVIAVTDGEDNAGRLGPKSLRTLPAGLDLALIGVGPKALKELNRAKKYAAATHSIEDFKDLYAAMSLCLAEIISQRVRIEVEEC